MEGMLRKNVEKVRLFQRDLYPKRYFIIDFTSANVYITHEQEFGRYYNPKLKAYTIKPTQFLKDEDPNKTVIPFRSILDAFLPPQPVSRKLLPADWQYPFTVATIGRKFILFAPTSDERKMWIAGFKYVVASTRTVQSIMQ